MAVCRGCKWIGKLYPRDKWWCYVHGCEAYPLASACDSFEESKSYD